ncbi:hypothetical protein Tco_1406721 [Tanacetum coccineum]
MTRATTTRVNISKRDEMPQIPSKFVKSLTFGASTSWDPSHLLKATNTYLWRIDYCQMGEAKALPPTSYTRVPEFFEASHASGIVPFYHKSFTSQLSFGYLDI